MGLGLIASTIKDYTMNTLNVAREEDLKQQQKEIDRIKREIKRNQWKRGLKRDR